MSPSLLRSLAAAFMTTLLVSGNALAGQTYDMGSAVDKALRDNHGVESTTAARDAAEEGRKSARGAFGPSLSSSYGYKRLDEKPIAYGRELDNDTYTWSVGVKQPLFTGFNLLSTYQKAALEKERQEAELRKTRLTLTLGVQQAFLGYLKAQQDIRSARDAVVRLREQLKVTQAFYDVGLRPRLDVLQAEVDLSKAESDLIKAESAFETQKVRLNTLLIIPVEEDTSYVGDLEYRPFDRSFEACLEQAYRMRPDMHIAAKSIEIADKDSTIAASGFYPQVSAGFDWAAQGDHPEASGSTLDKTGFNQWSTNVTASMNVFEWGRTYYGVQQAKQIVNKVRADEASLRQEIAYEVKSRLLAATEATKRIAVARKALDQASEAYRMALARYQAQVGTNTDVLDAQAKLTLAEAGLTGAKADYLVALAQLFASIGELRPDLSGG